MFFTSTNARNDKRIQNWQEDLSLVYKNRKNEDLMRALTRINISFLSFVCLAVVAQALSPLSTKQYFLIHSLIWRKRKRKLIGFVSHR